MCTLHYRLALFVYYTFKCGTVCVLYTREKHCDLTVFYKEALCVYSTVYVSSVCLYYNVEGHSV